MKKYFSRQTFFKIKTYALAHKVISVVVIVVVLGGSYYQYKKVTSGAGKVLYVTSIAEKGTIVSSINGTGQVSSSNEIDIKPKISGELVWINAKAGDVVGTYQALMGVDNTKAKRAVTSAEQALATSRLQFQKDEAQAPIDFQKANDALVNAKNDLTNTLNDTFNTISNTYLNLPNEILVAQNILYGFDLDTTKIQWNIDLIKSMFSDNEPAKTKVNTFANKAKSDYSTARTKYDSSIILDKEITRQSNQNGLYNFLEQSIDTTTSIAQALQSELNLLAVVMDTSQTYNTKIPGAITTMQTNTRNNLSTTNNDLSNLLAQKKNIDSARQVITTDEQNITLLQVGNLNGQNPISLQISKNNLATQEENLGQLKADLSDYTIVAPFAGTISAVNVKRGDNASPAGAVASIISSQTLAKITLNEVDLAKVKLGQKVTVTFDAISGLTITGKVTLIDPAGTVSQGVVSYGVQITFDTQDDRIKSGMSLNADIITDLKQDVITVPNSAVKTNNGLSYVEIFDIPLIGGNSSAGVASAVLPREQIVEIGTSNDSQTEITSGLKEGDTVVTRTITAVATKSTTPTLLSGIGGARPATSGGTRRFGN